MAQLRMHDWRDVATSAELNARWEEAFGNVVLNGLNVVPGSTGMYVSIQPGAGLVDGLTFIENATLENVLVLSQGHGLYPRYDAIVARYVRQETTPPPEVTYLVIQGTPAPNPQKPSVNPQTDLVLAYIYVPAQCTRVTPDLIENAPKLRDRLALLVPKGVLTQRKQPFYQEGQVWQRATDPANDPTADLRVGDLWVNTSTTPSTVYLWDGERWVDLTDWETIKNRPETMPPQVHDLAGPAHIGKLPIERVSGHTAFGPVAHQEAFAASVLRRP